MRVGLAIETDSPGGAETMLLELAKQLLARGHEVVGLGPTGGAGWLTARLADLGIERDLIDFRGPFGLASVPQIASVIRSRRLSVLHSHDFAMAVCGALGARLAGCRHVITMHGGTYYASARRRRLALRLATVISRHTVAVSEDFRRSFAGSLGLSQRAVEVVPNGVQAVAGVDRRIREDLGVGASDILVVAVGNLLAVKGHAVLLEALDRLQGSSPRLVVAIAGTGPVEANLRATASALGIEGSVRLLGYRADVPDLLHAADIFAMPSRSEGMPMAMIEAMLAAKPIVASDAGGIRELLPTPDLGALVRPGDPVELAEALARLVGDPARRRLMGDAARSRASERFTASAMADRYLALYED